jgi:uncharacterized iron-regulated membrane protein
MATGRAGTRRIFKWIHTWIGLGAGMVIAIVSLAGSVAVFRSEIPLASFPRSAGSAIGLDEISKQLAQAKPEAQVLRVRFPVKAGDPFVVQVESGGKQERVVCDAADGHVQGTLNTAVIDWTIDLHRNLLVGKTGRKLVGAVGIVLFVLAASGLLLWLIGARQWRSWISVRPKGGTRRFSFELHRTAGLWSNGLLLVVAFTGIGLSYPDTFRGALRSVTGSPSPAKAPRVAPSGPQALHSLDEYVRTAARSIPDGVPTELRLPENATSPVDLRLHRPGDLSLSGNHVYLDASTGGVLAVSREVDQPLATRIFAAFAPIHYGEFSGLPGKVLWALLGLLPTFLFVTGLITWWRPRARKAPLEAQEDLALVESEAKSEPGVVVHRFTGLHASHAIAEDFSDSH